MIPAKIISKETDSIKENTLSPALTEKLTTIGTHVQHNFDNDELTSGYMEQKYNPSTGFYSCRWRSKRSLTRSGEPDLMDFGSDYSKNSSLRDGVSFLEMFSGDYVTAARVQHLAARHLLDTCELCIYDKKARIRRPIRSREEIWSIFSLKKAAGNDFIKKMQDANLLVEADVDIKTTGSRKKQSRYFFNPVLLCRPIHIETFNFFREWLRPYLYPPDYKAMENIYSILHDPLQREAIEKAAEEAAIISDLDVQEVIDEIFNDNEKTQGDHMATFKRTVLRGYEPQLCGPYSHWNLTDKAPEDNTNIYFCTQHMKDLTGGHKAENVNTYRNICIDIDMGKESGQHLPIEEVSSRKKTVYDTLMKVLPSPSCVVDSRNGYHFYWSTSETVNYELWHIVAEEVKTSLAGIIDPVVTCDAARVLRMPGSIHIKDDCEPYDVTIVYSDDKIYSYKELSAAFKSKSEKIQAAKADLMAQYPAVFTQNKPATAATKKGQPKAAAADEEPVAYENQSARVQDIIDLDCSTFDANVPAVTIDYGDAIDYIKENVDLASFLGIDTPAAFYDIFHNGSHASATIYAPDERAYYWRYVCHAVNDGRPIDIFTCVQLLAGCDFKTALEYICIVNNIFIQPNTAAA